jgi:hypothetical protein
MKHEVSIIMYSRNMRYDSGFEKRKKKQRLEAAAQSQKSAHDRFVLKEYQINSENQTAEGEALLKLVKEIMLILAKKLVVRNFSKFKLVKSYLSSTIT